MTVQQFTDSVTKKVYPAGLNVYQQSLWRDAAGDWESAHALVGDLTDQTAAWIHAYLHRKEGDQGNAAYWYRRAGKPMPPYSLEKEWQELIEKIVGQQ